MTARTRFACDCPHDDRPAIHEHEFACAVWDHPVAQSQQDCIWDSELGDVVALCVGENHKDSYVQSLDSLFDDWETWSADPPPKPATTVIDVEAGCICTPPKQWACSTCGVSRSHAGAPWKEMPVYGTNKWGPSGGGGWNTTAYTPKCRHWREPVVYPSGLTMYASSSAYHGPREGHADTPVPQWGMYLASGWQPDTIGYLVPWPDFNLPKCPWDQLIDVTRIAMNLARDGTIVEVGCVGGHGRTGTMLAIIAVLDGMPAEDAVEWVRTNYCDHAVESEKQEWLPLWIEATVAGVEPPPMPIPPPPPPRQEWKTPIKSASQSTLKITSKSPKWQKNVPGLAQLNAQVDAILRKWDAPQSADAKAKAERNKRGKQGASTSTPTTRKKAK